MSSQAPKKVALITGGSRGLGRCEVLSIARSGIHCLFTYNSRQEEAEEVAEAARRYGVEAHALKLDLAKTNSFGVFVKDLKLHLSKIGVERIDFLINNAGMSYHCPFEKVSEEDLDKLFAINFKGVFFLTQKLLPLINDGGRVINTSSGSTRFAFISPMIAYAAIKGALEPYTRYLAQELAPRRITVNAIAPGPVGTDFSGGMIRDNPQFRENISKATALGRPGKPEDIGPVVAALLAEGTHWLNGERIEISGGMRL